MGVSERLEAVQRQTARKGGCGDVTYVFADKVDVVNRDLVVDAH